MTRKVFEEKVTLILLSMFLEEKDKPTGHKDNTEWVKEIKKKIKGKK